MGISLLIAAAFAGGWILGRVKLRVETWRSANEWFDKLDIDEQHNVVGPLERVSTGFSVWLLRAISAKCPPDPLLVVVKKKPGLERHCV